MSNQSTPQKPANAPADAFWEDESWTAGPRDAAGRRVGTWTSWRANGELECIDEFGDGTQRLTYRRFHPDGSESQRGEKDLVKDAWVGLMRWTRAAGPSPEDRYWDASLGETVHAIERDLDDGYIVTQRTFDAQGHPVASDGQPLPPRPENVPAEAYYEPSGRVWLLEQRALANGALRGERRVWDRNGALCERSLHEPANAPREQDTYRGPGLHRRDQAPGEPSWLGGRLAGRAPRRGPGRVCLAVHLAGVSRPSSRNAGMVMLAGDGTTAGDDTP